MKELEGITSSKHLRESKGKRMLDASYAVAMSDFSYELLFSFLQGARLTAVLGVINRHVPVARVRRPPLQVSPRPRRSARAGRQAPRSLGGEN